MCFERETDMSDYCRCCCCSNNVKAAVSMIAVQMLTTAMLLLSKLVLNNGIFVFALLTYRNAIGAVFVAPFAFCFEREMRRKLSWEAALWIFINALFGISMAMALYYYGLRETTAAYSSNFLNLIPIVTFIFAVVAGIERLGLRSRAGQVKIVGTVLCVGGAMVVSLYKGKVLHIWPSMHHNLAKEVAVDHNWLRGTLLLLCSCISYASWFIAQVKLFKVFPSKYWATMLTCMAACFQTVLLGLLVCRDKAAWRLTWDLQLMTVIFTGMLNTGATFCIISWVIAKKGPTYPSMFNSLSVISTTILESLFMGQDITIGSLIGMLLIIGGLYSFLWGKANEVMRQKVSVGDIMPISDSVQLTASVSMDTVLSKDVLPLHNVKVANNVREPERRTVLAADATEIL